MITPQSANKLQMSPNPTANPHASNHSNLHVPGRLSLRSPIRITPSVPSMVPSRDEAIHIHPPRSPSVSEIYIPGPNQYPYLQGPSADFNHQRYNQGNCTPYGQMHGYFNSESLAQPIYATPETSKVKHSYPNHYSSAGYASQNAKRHLMPPSPRSVHRSGHSGGPQPQSSTLRQSNH